MRVPEDRINIWLSTVGVRPTWMGRVCPTVWLNCMYLLPFVACAQAGSDPKWWQWTKWRRGIRSHKVYFYFPGHLRLMLLILWGEQHRCREVWLPSWPKAWNWSRRPGGVTCLHLVGLRHSFVRSWPADPNWSPCWRIEWRIWFRQGSLRSYVLWKECPTVVFSNFVCNYSVTS